MIKTAKAFKPRRITNRIDELIRHKWFRLEVDGELQRTYGPGPYSKDQIGKATRTIIEYHNPPQEKKPIRVRRRKDLLSKVSRTVKSWFGRTHHQRKHIKGGA